LKGKKMEQSKMYLLGNVKLARIIQVTPEYLLNRVAPIAFSALQRGMVGVSMYVLSSAIWGMK
jgi:hypothetical protein